MWKLFWKLYKKWLLVCVVIVLAVLVPFFAYFKAQYPKIRQANIEASFEELETLIRYNQKYSKAIGKLPRDKRLPTDLDYELALRTVQRARQLMSSGQLEYQDFAELRYLNRLPLDRRPMGREYNRLFQQMNELMDRKVAAEPGPRQQASAVQRPGEATGESVLPAMGAASLAPEASREAVPAPAETASATNGATTLK